LAAKLWTVAKIQGHKNPFGKPIDQYNVAELDFILEMEARDNPDAYRFRRNGIPTDGSHLPEVKAAWMNVLRGNAQKTLTAGIAFDAVKTYRERKQGGLTPGLRTRGK
jgi:hypothetical protein